MSRQILVSPLLRLALRLDALISLAVGAATCALATPMAAELGLGAGWMLALGLFMLAYGVVIGALGGRPRLPRWLGLTLAIGNALWALDCLLLYASGWLSPSGTGIALIAAHAVGAALLALLQGAGLRRSERLPA